MLLVLGDSYAFHFRSVCGVDGAVAAVGWRGARVGCDEFRRWAISQEVLRQPRRVLLMAGSNDLARPEFRLRLFFAQIRELSLGLLAAGAEEVLLLPIPPRLRLREQDVTLHQYQRRRWLTNRLLRRKFGRPPVWQVPFEAPPGFIGSDGVHPSAVGWRALASYVRKCEQ